jgi:hypothetical protein
MLKSYGSRTLTKTERKYCVIRKELLAIVHFVKHFRHFLYETHIAYKEYDSVRQHFGVENQDGA